MSTLNINCILIGDNPSNAFVVEVPKTRNVNILKDLIKEALSNRLKHVDASDLTVWKVSAADDSRCEATSSFFSSRTLIPSLLAQAELSLTVSSSWEAIFRNLQTN